MKQDDDEFWSGLGERLRPRLTEAHWTAQRCRILSRLTPEGSASPFAGWWKVPALSLVSCAVYVLCVEAALLPRRPPEAPAAALSAILSDGQEPGEGRILSMMLEGAKK